MKIEEYGIMDESKSEVVGPDYPRVGWGLYHDPLYGYISLPPFIRQALDLPSMQRLRRIKQLSTVELAFSGASYNRFEHSVGVYYLATLSFDALSIRKESEGYKDWPMLGKVQKIALQLAALFHDIGHGPWSHVFELYCHRNSDFREWHHENITKELIQSGKGEYSDVPLFINSLSAQLKARGYSDSDFICPENIAEIALGHLPPKDHKYIFLSQIISSECDVDRMDYLRRDSFHIGLGVGGVDVWEIIHNFTLAPDMSDDKSTGIYNLRVLSPTAEAVEALLTVRDLMYRRVYYHPTPRTAQEMMIRAIYDISKKFNMDELCLLTDEELLKTLESKQGSSFTRNIAKGIRFRKLYHSIPTRVTVYADLDEEGRRKWSRYISVLPGSFDNLISEEKKISDELSLGNDNRIIFDISPVPITKLEAYDSKYFYDLDEKEDKSLKELLPHLELTHGEIIIGGVKVSSYERYENEISKLTILIPLKYINFCVQEIKDHYFEEKKDLVEKPEILHKIIEDLYNKQFSLVVESFANLFLSSETSSGEKLCKKLKKGLINHIHLVYDQLYGIGIF